MQFMTKRATRGRLFFILLTLALASVSYACSGKGMLVPHAGSAPTDKPTAAAAAFPRSGQAPKTIHCYDGGSTPVGGISKWEWNFGDQQGGQDGWLDYTTTQGSAYHTYTTPGTYNAHLRVTATNGRTDTAKVQLSITATGNINPVAVSQVTPQMGPAPLSVDFGSTGSNDPDGFLVKYEWDFGDGVFHDYTSTSGTASRVYSAAGTHAAVLRVTDDNGAVGTSAVEILVSGSTGSLSGWAVHRIDGMYSSGQGTEYETNRISARVIGGQPAVAFISEGEGIKYARALTSAPQGESDWQVHVVRQTSFNVDLNSGPSLLEVNGRPALSWFEGWKTNYAVANTPTPASASDWNIYTVDGNPPGGDWVGIYSSMALVNGKPAIACGGNPDNGNYLRIRYSHAVVADPQSAEDWQSGWVTEALASSYPRYTSLVELNGRPAIGWCLHNDAACFSLADSATPASPADWNSYAVETGEVGRWLSLVVVAGMPAMSYLDWTGGGDAVRLHYARATATEPLTAGDWTIHQASAEALGDYATSLVDFQGRPAIAYYRGGPITGNGPKFIWADSGTPASEADWQYFAVEDRYQTGPHVSLTMAGGTPIEAYWDFPAQSLRFAQGLN
jgi:PKD repeat protein